MATTRYACAMDGQGLQDIDPSVYITDIQEAEPRIRADTLGSALRDGQRLTRLHRESLAVSVTFEVHERDAARRKAVAQRACEWARDGWLTISDRPGQRLWVVCDRLPVVTSALRWTDRLTVGFTAYALPYWQEAHPVSASFTGARGTAYIAPAGTRDCCLEAEITAQSGTVDLLTIAVNGRRFAFEGLGLARGQTLVIGYDDEHHRQFMRVGDRSALGKRTAASADDLILHPRMQNAVTIEADAPVRATLKGRGLWR